MSAFPPDELRSERLLLRRPVAADAQAIFGGWSTDPDVTRYLTWRPHVHIDDTHAYIERADKEWVLARGHRPYLMERVDDGRVIGGIGVSRKAHSVIVGYVLARRHWGQGYCTEALKAVSEAAFQDPGVFRLWAVCDVLNPASARVMEKAGMSREGLLRSYCVHPNVSDRPRDVLCYSLVRDAG